MNSYFIREDLYILVLCAWVSGQLAWQQQAYYILILRVTRIDQSEVHSEISFIAA